jgi:hypothetical protein
MKLYQYQSSSVVQVPLDKYHDTEWPVDIWNSFQEIEVPHVYAEATLHRHAMRPWSRMVLTSRPRKRRT